MGWRVNSPLRGSVVLERYGSPPERVALPRLPALDRVGVLHEMRRAIAEGTARSARPRTTSTASPSILGLASSVETRSPVRL